MARSIDARILGDDLLRRLAALGARIRAARVKRRLRQADLAARTRLSKSTIEKIERGEPSSSLGAYAQALWVLGLDRELDLIADPGLDREGLAYSVEDKRVRIRRPLDNDF
jgi:transcriptional regulator with XRE-family HTH domain